jgi:restriction system protein
MFNNIREQIGNPREVVAWSAPDEWIPVRLSGDVQSLAQRIWQQTNHVINPRYTRGCWFLTQKHDLLRITSDGILEKTEIGKEFLRNNNNEFIAKIDRMEGIINILQILSQHNPARRNEILPEYSTFCTSYTTYQAVGVHRSSLFERIKNLLERNMISRSGILYELTDIGIDYLRQNSALIIGRSVSTKQSQLQFLIKDINNEARKILADTLAEMDPYKFEHLIKSLLEEMGYSNVTVTSPSNDKGVDVIGDIELGISSVKEVVQVKRHVGSINRPVLDQLRGSLPMFDAIRGTIITTGKFAKGTISAALDRRGAPITLIDGNKLLSLLMQYEIGISKRLFELYEYDDSKLAGFIDSADELEESQ